MADQETSVPENDPAPTGPSACTPSAVPPARLPYTRHATAGTKDDRIVDPAWYQFLVVMLVIGGVALLCWLVYGGYRWGSSGCYTCYQNQPVVVFPVAPPQKSASAVQPQVALPPPVIQLQLPAPIKIQVEADVNIKIPAQPAPTVPEKPKSIWDQPGNK